MKIRSLATIGALAAAGLAFTPVAAQAAPTDSVTNLKATIAQKAGSNSSWIVTGSWTKNPDASSYRVYVADNAAGTAGEYAWADTAASTKTLEVSQLAEDSTYWFAVVSKATGSTVATTSFQVPELDTQAPVASYRVNRTRAVLLMDTSSMDFARRAPVVLTQTATNEPVTSRTIIPGDGTADVSWPVGQATAPVVYTKAGIFTPKVRVSDVYGNTREVALPKVTVVLDTTKPSISVTKPAKPTKVASWRVIRGTASDADSGLAVVGAVISQKRGGVWWVYDFKTKKWLKGFSSYKKTTRKSKANPAIVWPKASGTWATPKVKGLTKAPTIIEAAAFDNELNERDVRVGPIKLR